MFLCQLGFCSINDPQVSNGEDVSLQQYKTIFQLLFLQLLFSLNVIKPLFQSVFSHVGENTFIIFIICQSKQFKTRDEFKEVVILRFLSIFVLLSMANFIDKSLGTPWASQLVPFLHVKKR